MNALSVSVQNARSRIESYVERLTRLGALNLFITLNMMLLVSNISEQADLALSFDAYFLLFHLVHEYFVSN